MIDNAAILQEGDFVDIHCHCLAGIDDGPCTYEDSLALCRALVEDGISVAIATPHQLGRYDDNTSERIRREVDRLNEGLQKNKIALTVEAGGDIRVDERMCRLLQEDKILTLADSGRYILIELPHDVFLNIEPLLEQFSSIGIVPIVSHPERHNYLAQHPEIIADWLGCSAQFQITAASLLGHFGTLAERACLQFIKSGYISFVATDSHGAGRRKPYMTAAFNRIKDEFGVEVAEKLCIGNPQRILKGLDTVPVSDVADFVYKN
ncbi:MAG: hypothetical protein PHF37_09175 [Phycisphaerae bacterium]|nr:hypothetical protein [Phycisphaerae bacterium]